MVAVTWSDAGNQLCLNAAESGILEHRASPSITTTPSFLITGAQSSGFGLSARTSMTPPARTGPRKTQSPWRDTVPGPGRSSGVTASRIAVVLPPCTAIPPNDLAAARSSSQWMEFWLPLMWVQRSLSPWRQGSRALSRGAYGGLTRWPNLGVVCHPLTVSPSDGWRSRVFSSVRRGSVEFLQWQSEQPALVIEMRDREHRRAALG